MAIQTKGHGLPSMTLGQLRDALNRLDESNLAKHVQVWLPGSRVILASVMPLSIDKDAILIEGNIAPGSALE